ncbi:hypothetical protein [Actinopolymorpha sp. B17G11]|uniref:hypothetical protein n=1 Tax=Actinopolymorpha sp. B17G11 TaxID=3160861 RepID=UPI0032E38F3D
MPQEKSPQETINAAAQSARKVQELHAAYQAEMRARRNLVREAFKANPDMPITKLAQAVGMSLSRVRQLCDDLIADRQSPPRTD